MIVYKIKLSNVNTQPHFCLNNYGSVHIELDENCEVTIYKSQSILSRDTCSSDLAMSTEY